MTWVIHHLAFDADFPTFHLILNKGEIRFEVIADYEIVANTLVIRRFDVDGSGPNVLGWAGLRDVARWVKQELRVDQLRIDGSLRTTGAGPGRRPRPLVF